MLQTSGTGTRQAEQTKVCNAQSNHQWYDTVQIPVLALPTAFAQFTHGVYCDEFAEFQFKDMPARELLGGFLPSAGVGTGFSRRALDRLPAAEPKNKFVGPPSAEEH